MTDNASSGRNHSRSVGKRHKKTIAPTSEVRTAGDAFEEDWALVRSKGELNRGRGKRLDLTDRYVHHFRVGKFTGKRTSSGSAIWACTCLGAKGQPCGNLKEVSTDNLMKGKVKSCGCLLRSRGDP